MRFLRYIVNYLVPFMSRFRLFLLFLVFSGTLLGQDHLAPLHSNPVLKKFWKTHPKTITTFATKKAHSKVIAKLPFLDDFSRPGPFPNDSLWQDSNAFINYSYPICPHTLGVATLDGVNKYGEPYNPNASPYSSLPADTFTSQPIGLKSNTLGNGDSVYFSFYWQAGGLGTYPKTNDSLLLQFHYPGQKDSIFFPADSSYVPGDSIWLGGPDSVWNPGYYVYTAPYVIVDTGFTTVWYHLGYIPAPTDTNFHFVLIPITNPNYFSSDGFQFRFINYACTSGNVDHWNIDEVYLNKFRNYQDSTQKDMSFVYEAQSLLANYEYMPWEQFTGLSDLRDTLHTFLRNNYDSGSLPLNALYSYEAIPGFLNSYSGGSNNELPFYDSGYIKYPPHTRALLSYAPYTPLSGPTIYTFTETIKYPGDFDQWNDTLRFDQIFGNYYAYDDGTAECAYFLNGYPSVPAQLAEQFTLNKPDTLYAMEVYFDYVFVDSKNYSFYFTVWDDNGGSPGNVIYRDTVHGNVQYPLYSGGYDQYLWIKLQDSIPLKAGPVWVGWTQTYGDSLNIGFDLNDDHHNKIYYNINANAPSPSWNESSFAGSLMMRPVMSDTRKYLAVNEVPNTYSGVKLYPNPAKDVVNFSDELRDNSIKIFSADGRLCNEYSHFSGNSISTSNLPTGFYIVQLTSPEGKSTFEKLLISR
jgi:hypothetical protein